MSKLKSYTIEFYVGKKKHSFVVEHNMPDIPGLRLIDAVENWVHRTNDYSKQSLIDYIESKNTGYEIK